MQCSSGEEGGLQFLSQEGYHHALTKEEWNNNTGCCDITCNPFLTLISARKPNRPFFYFFLHICIKSSDTLPKRCTFLTQPLDLWKKLHNCLSVVSTLEVCPCTRKPQNAIKPIFLAGAREAAFKTTSPSRSALNEPGACRHQPL